MQHHVLQGVRQVLGLMRSGRLQNFNSMQSCYYDFSRCHFEHIPTYHF